MPFELHPYVLIYTPAGLTKKRKPRKPKALRQSFGSDNEAKLWAGWVIERDGGKAEVRLSDGTLFTCEK